MDKEGPANRLWVAQQQRPLRSRPLKALHPTHNPRNLSWVAEVLVGLATDTTVYLSRCGSALKVNKLLCASSSGIYFRVLEFRTPKLETQNPNPETRNSKTASKTAQIALTFHFAQHRGHSTGKAKRRRMMRTASRTRWLAFSPSVSPRSLPAQRASNFHLIRSPNQI